MFAFPYASFPLESRRRSGFLAPYYSQTNTRGLEIGVPYYWNIAPEQDLTVTPVYMARRGYQVKNLYRYLSPSYTGEARFEYLPNDPIFGATRTIGAYKEACSYVDLHSTLNSFPFTPLYILVSEKSP